MSRITLVLSCCAAVVLLMSGHQWLSGGASSTRPLLSSQAQLSNDKLADAVKQLQGTIRLMDKRLRAVETRSDKHGSHEIAASGEAPDHTPSADAPQEAHEEASDEPDHVFTAGGMSSGVCKSTAICTVGDATAKAIAWKLPPGKYEGAKCRGAAVCKFGPRHPDFVGKKTAFHDMADSHVCPKYPKPADIQLLPKWVIESGAKRARYTEIQEKLSIQDRCVEAWRAKHAPRERPCMRCHGIANDPVLSKIYAELIARLPRCHRLCETGFNRGDSSIILTTACGHGSHSLSFSLNTRWYTRPGMACQDEVFASTGSTNTIVEGYSTTSISDFVARNAASKDQCDVIMVDGIKSAHGRYQDLADLAPLAHRNTLWITDDVEIEGAHKEKPKHCIHKVFFAFAKEQGFDVRCWPTGSGGFMGQCYGYRDWDALLGSGESR